MSGQQLLATPFKCISAHAVVFNMVQERVPLIFAVDNCEVSGNSCGMSLSQDGFRTRYPSRVGAVLRPAREVSLCEVHMICDVLDVIL